MKSLESVLLKYSVLFLVSLLLQNAVFAEGENVADVIRFVSDSEQWTEGSHRKHILKEDKIYQYIELLGAIRNDDPQLIENLAGRFDYQYSDTRPADPHMWFRGRRRHKFIVTLFVRIGVPTLEKVLDKIENTPKLTWMKLQKIEGNSYTLVKDRDDFNHDTISNCRVYFHELLPYESAVALIDDKLERVTSSKSKDSEASFKRFNDFFVEYKYEPPKQQNVVTTANWSDFVCNHPLYKARQATIESNLKIVQDILKANGAKKISAIDGELKAKLFAAIGKLGEVRAVEAAAVIAPLLLLESDDVDANLDKKYLSFQKYPAGVALAKIGIPSIWAILDEIAIRSNQSDEYRQLAAKVTSTILIKKAIPGFVREILDKYKDDEIAQIRLAKLLPLLGEDATKIPQLKPQLRTWKSTDGKFETLATFVSINTQKDITLKKENNKQTVIELSALRKLDQDYIREMTRQ